MPEVVKWQPLVGIYRHTKEFITAMDKIVKGNHPRAAELRAMAKKNTWDHRAKVVHATITKIKGKKK